MRFRSDFGKSFRRITKAIQLKAEFVHQRQIQTAHLAIWFVEIVEDSSGLQFAAAFAQNDHRQFVRIMAAGVHAAAIHQHAVVERGAFTLLNSVELSGNVSKLLNEEAVHFEPVIGFLM